MEKFDAFGPISTTHLNSLNITFSTLSPPKSLICSQQAKIGSKVNGKFSKLRKPDKETLQELYTNGLSLPKLGRLFGAHRTTISRWMRNYGIRTRSFNKLWTEKEIYTLKEWYPKLNKIEMILPMLPNRTLGSICKRASNLGIKRIPRKRPSREELEKLYWKLGTKQAAKFLDISQTTFRRWVKSAGGQLRVSIKNPNLSPTAELIYILGVLKGDGYVYKRGRANVIELTIKSEEFANSFASALRKIGLAPSLWIRSIKRYENYQVYVVTAISKKFVEWYNNVSLMQIKGIIGKNKESAAAFVRGFYESEGSYFVDPRDGTPAICICNTNKFLLLFVKDLISLLGYDLNMNDARPTSTGKPFYRLRKSGRTIPELVDKIKPCIKAMPSNVDQVPTGGRMV